MSRRLGIDDPPHVTADDWRALFWLCAIALIVIAMCAVPPEWLT